MTKAPIGLQDLRRSLYVKAKAEPLWRFWGLYVHVCKMETLHEAYRMARSNNGAPGIDGVTFEAIEGSGVEGFLGQIRDQLVTNTYRPMLARKKEIPKDGGKKVRILSIPTIRDRVVQGALKLILEPIFEADFQSGSYGYRPKRTAHEAVARVARAIVEEKTRIIDLDLTAYFDNVQHSLLLEKVARRVQDDAVMHLLKMMLKATGKKGVPQGGVITPRTQSITIIGLRWRVGWRRSLGRGLRVRVCQRNGMPDCDCVGAHQDFLDEKPNDLSAADQIQVFCIALQSFTEITETVNHAQESRLILSGHVKWLQLRANGLLLLPKVRHTLA